MRSYRQANTHAALPARVYAHGTRARYNSAKCRCVECRRANADYEQSRQRDPRIPAVEVRAHLAALSEQGIGLRAVSDATDIPRVALVRWHLGQPTIRRSQAERILATDATIIADHATVDAAETQRLLRELIEDGYTRTRIAAQLGPQARVPALQYKSGRVLAKTALRVRKLHALLLAEGEDIEAEKPRGLKEQILAALAWFDSITAEDLFESMCIGSGDAQIQALHRLWKSGEVERLGDGKPYRYRVAVSS